MNALVCELCGSNNIVKQDGFFVCQNCGTKYSTEEAKKMMIEGTVDVSGSTVKVDKSDELKNLYEIARRAKNENNAENARMYYEKILVKDPKSWEAAFYSVYFQSMNCKIAGITGAANRVTNCELTVLQLIKETLSTEEDQKKALLEICSRLISISLLFFNAAKNHYNSIDISIRDKYKGEYGERIIAAKDVVMIFADYFDLENKYGKEISVPCWKVGIDEMKEFRTLSFNKQPSTDFINKYSEKIRKYDISFQTPVETSSGCYVATAVYGSYDCPQVWTLRRYRDNTLAQTWYGRAFIHTYYAVSPSLVKWFGNTEWFRMMWKPKLDKMVADLKANGVEDTPYEDRNW